MNYALELNVYLNSTCECALNANESAEFRVCDIYHAIDENKNNDLQTYQVLINSQAGQGTLIL